MELLVVIALALGLLTISLLKRGIPAAEDPDGAAWWGRCEADPLVGPIVRAGPEDFVETCRSVLARWGLELADSEETGDGCIHWRMCSDRPMTGGDYLVVLRHASRETDPVGRAEVMALSDAVRARGALKGILITNGRFAPGAGERAEGPPLALYDGAGLARLREDPGSG